VVLKTQTVRLMLIGKQQKDIGLLFWPLHPGVRAAGSTGSH